MKEWIDLFNENNNDNFYMKKDLLKGLTEEQITNLLNNYHIQESNKVKELENQINSLSEQNSKYSDYEEIKSKLNEIEKNEIEQKNELKMNEIKQLVKKYSDYIRYPIKMEVTKREKNDKE